MSNEREELLDKVKKKADDTYALLSSLSLSHEILKDKLQDVTNDLSGKISIEYHREAIGKVHSVFEEIKKEIQSLKDHKDTIYAKIRILESNIKELQNVHREILCEQYDSNVRLQEVRNSVIKAREDLDNNMHLNVASSKKHVLEKIDQVCVIIPKNTVNMEQVKEQIANQIEPTSLDSRNALLTAKNHEQRLSIAEKKLEGALLQLKNLELHK